LLSPFFAASSARMRPVLPVSLRLCTNTITWCPRLRLSMICSSHTHNHAIHLTLLVTPYHWSPAIPQSANISTTDMLQHPSKVNHPRQPQTGPMQWLVQASDV
jgi:hypothetical protein